MGSNNSPRLSGPRVLCGIEALAAELDRLRERQGRLFLIGVGGSAGNCSHAVNDFRKLCGIEAYSPVDNVSELTARANDEGWDTIFSAWLEVSRLGDKDAILIYSVGGGDLERNISPNIVEAVDLAKARSAKVFGIVGRDSGYTAKHGDVVVVIPPDRSGLGHPAVSGGGLALFSESSILAAQANEMVTLKNAVFLDRDVA